MERGRGCERGPLCAYLVLCIILQPASPELLTQTDVELVSLGGKALHCFSRRFEDLTCFWEEERIDAGSTGGGRGGGGIPYTFHYSYMDEPKKECPLTAQRGDGGTLYICRFPEPDVRLYNELTVWVKIRSTNQMLYCRKLEVEKLVFVDPPRDIRVSMAESGRAMQVTWNPPLDFFSDMFKYQLQYWPQNSTHKLNLTLTVEDLPNRLNDLQSDVLYRLRVRTKVEQDEPMWGPWSEEITFFSPTSPEKIGLRCVTPDLVWVCCRWKDMAEVANASQLFYQYRGQDWHLCRHNIRMDECNCAFLGRNDTPVSIVMNMSSPGRLQEFYHMEPFWINHVVSPPPPDLHLQHLLGGKVALNWSVLMAGFEQDMIYEIRFLKDEEVTWKTLQVLRGVSHEVLDLIPGSCYTMQIRACPIGDAIQGFWSAWSAEVRITLPSNYSWFVIVIVLVLLSVPGAVLCTVCIVCRHYRKVKDLVWPQLPDLHKVLDTFFAEIQKQYKENSTFYEKQMEETLQMSCLEVLGEEAMSPDILQISQDYVQLSPPIYQNEDYWPKLGPNISSDGRNQTSGGISNQTYLTTIWNF
uniref:MPL proto-onco, thrombopoietin receptor n=1 Tax=Leptobrachium leishanense TaxID=445787 RepID=A0A8C5QQ56_9ANUR